MKLVFVCTTYYGPKSLFFKFIENIRGIQSIASSHNKHNTHLESGNNYKMRWDCIKLSCMVQAMCAVQLEERRVLNGLEIMTIFFPNGTG